MPTFEQIAELVKNVGVPAGALFFILWRLEARLIELVKAVQAAPVCATAEQVEAAAERTTAAINREIDHSTRNVLARIGDIHRL